MGFKKRLIRDLGIGQRDDESKHLDVSKHMRTILGVVFTLILLAKTASIIISLLITNPGLQETLGSNYHKNIDQGILLSKLVPAIIIIIIYGSTVVVVLNHKHKLTIGFFHGLKRRCRKLGIVIAITMTISNYLNYKGYNDFVNQYNATPGITKIISLDVLFFIPLIIWLVITVTSYGAFVAISYWSFNKLGIDVSNTIQEDKNQKYLEKFNNEK